MALHEANLKESEKNIFNEIIGNLDYSKLRVENRKNGESLIIIPLSNSITEALNSHASHLKFDKKTIFNLLIVQNASGKLRWSTIIGYNAENGSNKLSLSEKTVQNIINGEDITDNGLYKFINLKGKLQYQISYNAGKVHSFASPVREDLLNSQKSGKAAARGACFEYYLVTTVTYPDGHTEQFEEYLFTACDEDTEDPSGGGGGGGGGDSSGDGDSEGPNDQEVTIWGSKEISETSYREEDYQVPVTTDNPEEMDLDEDGNPAPPVSLPAPVKYNYTWRYTKLAVFPFVITGVYMNDATVHPANLTYETPQGWITRNITLFDQMKTATINGSSATMHWNFYVHTRHTNTTTNQTTTTQRTKNHYKTISL